MDTSTQASTRSKCRLGSRRNENEAAKNKRGVLIHVKHVSAYFSQFPTEFVANIKAAYGME